MKKIKYLFIALLAVFLTSGCDVKNKELDNAEIYTTIYPVTYIMEKLYGTDNTINSIYPNGVDLTNYSLTEKQINEYSQGDLFVYVGLGSEKDITKSFLNNNKDLLIIDTTYGLSYTNKIEELWLAPNNFLMLVKNVVASLSEYIDNKYVLENIDEAYEKMYVDLSWMDAELRNIAKEATENSSNTIITESNVFDYLKAYGFNVVSLESITNSEKTEIKAKFKNDTYNTILKLDTEKNTDFMEELKSNYNADIVEINSMITNDDVNSDYKSIQNENINKIRNIVLD